MFDLVIIRTKYDLHYTQVSGEEYQSLDFVCVSGTVMCESKSVFGFESGFKAFFLAGFRFGWIWIHLDSDPRCLDSDPDSRCLDSHITGL